MKNLHKIPYAYFLTFRTYATFLHGDNRQSVDKKHNIFNTPKMHPNKNLHNKMKKQCNESEFILTQANQKTVLTSICSTCTHFNWQNIAAHVRSNHVHILLRSDISKEKTLSKIKAYATQALKAMHCELGNRRKFWSTHGSTKLIWSEDAIFPAMYYIVAEQGNPTALYYDKALYESFDPALYELLRG